jgi:chromosome segregation ATPase
MNNLLFSALILALLYYFFYYLPRSKKNLSPTPFTSTQSTQTDEQENILNEPGAVNLPGSQYISEPEAIKDLQKEKQALLKDIQQQQKTITGLNKSYDQLETKTQQEITNLKQQLSQKDIKLKELSETENTVDQLIKGIQDLNQEL